MIETHFKNGQTKNPKKGLMWKCSLSAIWSRQNEGMLWNKTVDCHLTGVVCVVERWIKRLVNPELHSLRGEEKNIETIRCYQHVILLKHRSRNFCFLLKTFTV